MTPLLTFLRRWWPTLIVVAVILYATLNSDPTGEISFSLPGLDKLIHAIMFGGLFAAISFDRRRDHRHLTPTSLLATALICLIAGALDEVAQSAMHNGRSAEFLDFIADATGIAVAYFSAPPVINRIFRK